MESSPGWTRASLSVLAAFVAVRLSAGFQFHAVAVVAPLLVSALGLSYTEVGSLIGAYVLPAVLLSIPGGLVIQRFGDRRVLLASLALCVAGAALTAAGGGFATMLAGRLIAGTGGALVQIIVLKMATERFAGPRMSTATATALTAWPLGIALALAVLGTVAQAAGWRTALAVAAAYPLLVLTAVWWAARLFPASAQAPAANLRDFAGSQLPGLLPALAISLAWMLLNIGFSGFVAFAPTWLADIGRPLDRAGAAASLTGWALVAAQPWGGWIADRLRRPSLLLTVSIAGSAACMLATLPARGAEPLYVLVGLVMGLGPGVLGAALAMSARPDQRALAFALFATGSGAGSMLGPSLSGVAVDLAGASAAAIVLSGVTMASALLPWWWARHLRRARVTPGPRAPA